MKNENHKEAHRAPQLSPPVQLRRKSMEVQQTGLITCARQPLAAEINGNSLSERDLMALGSRRSCGQDCSGLHATHMHPHFQPVLAKMSAWVFATILEIGILSYNASFVLI